MSELRLRALVVGLLAVMPSGCGSDPEPRCAGSVFDCPAEWAQWPMRGSAAPQYVSTTDTVMDGVTGLMWQRKLTGEMLRWDDARKHCEGLALGGFSGWRLPSRMELVSILEYESIDAPTDSSVVPRAAIDASAFPQTPPTEFWSTSHFTEEKADYASEDPDPQAWTVSFRTGTFTEQPLDLMFPRARCVRTERAPAVEAATSATRWRKRSSTVEDVATGLVWQQSLGSVESVLLAESYCAGLTLDGTSGFRAPHVKELLTLAAATPRDGVAADGSVFTIPSFAYSADVVSATPAGTTTITGGSSPAVFSVELGLWGKVSKLATNPPPSAYGVRSENVRCVRSGKDGS